MKLPPSFEGAPIIQVAMDEELAPFLASTDEAGEQFSCGAAEYYPRTLAGEHKAQQLLLVRSKIGLVNAASAITIALQMVDDCPLVISAGTAGGLHTTINVGDIALGSEYTYTDADATAFGYTHGQVPGMPEKYLTASSLLNCAQEVAGQYTGEGTAHLGPMLAGGSFVTAHNVKDTRAMYPQALSTDMETTAIAQVCYNQAIPFIAVRGISDLCGPAADQDFHLGVDIVAPRSAQLALATLQRFLP